MKRKNKRPLIKYIILKGTPYLLLLPTMLWLLVFGYYPPISAFFHSFTRWDGVNPSVFIGLENYKYIFTSSESHIAFKNMAILVFLRIVTTMSTPLLAALLVFYLRNSRSARFYQVIFVLPIVVPKIVIWLLWRFIYDPSYGLLNSILRAIGLSHLQSAFLGDPKVALYCIAFIYFPWIDALSFLVYLAGLQAIPVSVHDAAKIDGTKGFCHFFRIDLPLIKDQVKVLLILTIIYEMQAFQIQLALTGGGPGYSTMVPGLLMYLKAMEEMRMGLSCTIAAVLFIIVFSLTLLVMRIRKTEV